MKEDAEIMLHNADCEVGKSTEKLSLICERTQQKITNNSIVDYDTNLRNNGHNKKQLI